MAAASAAPLMRRPKNRRHLDMVPPASFYQNDTGGSRLRRLRQVETTISGQRCYKLSQAIGQLKECV